jgi:hypothetical protein
VETDTRLYETAGPADLDASIRDALVADEVIVVSTHGNTIPEWMEHVGLECDRCAKGSVWELVHDGDGWKAVSYRKG